jgi:hypothetical protein
MERVLKGFVIAVEAFLEQNKKVSTNKERNAPCACLCLFKFLSYVFRVTHTHPHQIVFHQVKKMFRHCDATNQRPETPQRSDLRRSKTQPNVIA